MQVYNIPKSSEHQLTIIYLSKPKATTYQTSQKSLNVYLEHQKFALPLFDYVKYERKSVFLNHNSQVIATNVYELAKETATLVTRLSLL